MEIKKIGKFGLIDRLAHGYTKSNDSTIAGTGDDCAVLRYNGEDVLVATSLLSEGVHFDLTYIDMEHLGYKAAMTGFSNIFAMNGAPHQIMVNMALGRRLKIEDLDSFNTGLRMACEKWNVDVAGIDVNTSYTGLTIGVTAIGSAKEEETVYRNGANETDIICVSGDLGSAYMGLQLLEREKSVYYSQIDDINKKIQEADKRGDAEKLREFTRKRDELNDFQPDFAGKEYLLQRQLKPEARGDITQKLREAGIHPTAMTDITDGLSSELRHICSQSHAGCRIYEKNLPIDYQTAVMAEELNMDVYTCALNGGDDMEMLFTVPIGDYDKVKAIEGIRQIGYITKEELGIRLISADGSEHEMPAQGWEES